MRRSTTRIWVSIAVGTIIALLPILLDLFKAPIVSTAIFSSLPLWIDVVGFVVTAGLISAFTYWSAKLISAPETSVATAYENRKRMLQRVQDKWITRFLENETYYDKELIPLALHRCVGDPWDLVLQNPLESAESLPLDTKISDVFDQAEGKLLILGEPGVGKTTMLLVLTRDLLKRAKDDEEGLIPVVLMLSSWTPRKLSLEQWIVEELRVKYDIPSQIGQTWVDASQLLLLLEGLDEVAPDTRLACIESVNKYAAQAHRSIVVCSRTKEYLDLSGRLFFQTAVSVQPLSSGQIDDYLLTQGEYVSGLKSALEQSQTLRALATTPLFLRALILAYHGKPVQELLPLVNAVSANQQHVLFHAYVERMLQKEGPCLHATAQHTKHWLAWLARQLTAHHQTELYLEILQPNWLPKGQRIFYQMSTGLVVGLVSGLIVGLVSGLVFGLLNGSVGTGLNSGLPLGLVAGLVAGLLIGLRAQIEPAEQLTWSWKGLVRWLLFGLIGGLVSGLLLGLVGGLIVGLTTAALLFDEGRQERRMCSSI